MNIIRAWLSVFVGEKTKVKNIRELQKSRMTVNIEKILAKRWPSLLVLTCKCPLLQIQSQR